MKKVFKRLITLVLAITLVFGVAQMDAYAATKYKINGVTVSVTDYSSEPDECWVYANHLYRKIWGHEFSNKFDDDENSLRNLTDSQLTLTPEHLKRYVSNAELGAVLRVCDKKWLHDRDGWGHSQIIVQKDANGFTVLEGGLSNSPYRREHYYTWDGYCNSRWPGKYAYIKYIKWPGAPAFKEPNGTLEKALATDSSKVTLKWTTYWNFTAKYKVERATSQDGPWTVVATITDGSMTWTDTKAEPGKTYFYRVEPYDKSGDDGRYTNVVQVLTRSKLTTTADSSAEPSITLNWTKTQGYTAGYWVQKAASSKGPWTTVQTINDTNTTSWKDTDITSGTMQYYRVQPFNGSNKGGECSIVSGARAFALSAEPYDGTVSRVYGKSRYETSYQIAGELQESLGVDQFDAVVLATGTNFADALSGSYLAYVKGAPILLTNGQSDADAIKGFLENNLSEEGIVYILGGTAAVSQDLEDSLADYQVKRIKGANRYETNIEILKEAGVSEEELLICTGKNYADSLSASGAKKPILLVGESLSEKQNEYLDSLTCENFYIIGGDAAVSLSVEEDFAVRGTVERIKGKNRYKTSVAVASKFVENPSAVVLAYGQNFPDGLCGGPLVANLNAALVLAEESAALEIHDYVIEHQIKEGVVLGGSAAVSDLAVRVVYGMSVDDEIIAKKFQ